jgi:hypothetical protein
MILDAKAGIHEGIGPGSGFEEHELQLVPLFLRSTEYRLKHRLSAPEGLSPRHRYEDAHGVSIAIMPAVPRYPCAASITVGPLYP